MKESCLRRLHRRMQCLKVSPDHHRLMAVSSPCSKRCVSVLLQLRSDNSRTNYPVASSPRQVQNSRMLHHPVHPTTSVFARLDAAIKRAPNASMDFHESKICFSENTSAAWLCAKSPEGRSSLIRTARKQARIGVKDSRIRQEGIFKAKAAQLKEKQEQLTKRADRKRICNENVLSELSKYGGVCRLQRPR